MSVVNSFCRVICCVTFAWIALLGASCAQAHEPTELPIAQCDLPERPDDTAPPRVWQKFLDSVDNFRACTQRAMERHQAEAGYHQAAARQASNTWNNFVRDSLNAAEDFPHEGSKQKQTNDPTATDKVLSGNWDGWENKRRNF